jgi:serine/threonine protein kinase
MSLSIGTRLGTVEVLGIIGRGGMGEVYRARDTKLKRDVAIKTLPDEFLHDAVSEIEARPDSFKLKLCALRMR